MLRMNGAPKIVPAYEACATCLQLQKWPDFVSKKASCRYFFNGLHESENVN
jgi:hypothetical protein